MPDSPWASLIALVAATAAVIALAYWFTRHIVGGLHWNGFEMQQKGGQLGVLAQTSLGKDQRVAVLQAGERFFLVGITPQSVSLLAELTKEEAGAWLKEPPTGAAREIPFQQALLEKLQRGNRGEKQ